MKVSSGAPCLLVIAVSVAAMFAGCPLPFDYNGQGAGASRTSDPSTPKLTAAVTVSYSEQGGTTGTIASNGTYTTGKTTTVTLSTATDNAVIYYTDDGTQITNYGTPKKINGSSGQITITRTTSLQTLDIHAVAIGPNMLPSPAFHATLVVSPYPILSVACDKTSASEDGGTATFTITSSSAPTTDITVRLLTGGTYTPADLTGLPASGTSFSATLVHSTTTISLSITGVHNAVNANPTVTLTVQPDPNAPPAYTVGAPASASVVIQNDSSYTVTYNGNGNTGAGGTVPTDGNLYLPGATVTVLGNSGGLVKAGYVFAGWNTKADGSGTTYTQGQTFTMGTSNVTLYAVWSKSLYVTNGSNNSISAYTIGSGGALTAISGTFTTGSGPSRIAISPNGSYLYVANNLGASISAYTIGSGGSLTPISGTFTTGTNPWWIAISPNGNYLYVANWGSNSISAYTIGSGGSLTASGTFTTGYSPEGIAISPNGNYLYVANWGSNSISAYTIGSGGSLTASGTLTTGSYPHEIAISPNGNYLYVSNDNGISAYTIGSGGSLTAGTFTTGSYLHGIAISPNGNYLYVSNNLGASISAYTIGSGGSLTASGTFTTGSYPEDIAISPDGNYLYVANSNSSSISAYTVGSGGALTAITSGTLTTGSGPAGIAIMP